MKKARLILTATVLAFTSMTFVSCGDDDKDNTCNTGYEGKDCKTLSRDKFVGVWKLDETCTQGTDNYTLTITAGSNGDLSLIMTNVYNQNFTATATITASNSIKFDGTSAGNVSFNGNGTYELDGTISISYSVNDGTNSNTCNATGTKL